MARKSLYSREDVLEAAIAVVESDGIGGLTARKVGERLGASTAPVYSNFESMDELELAVLQKAKDLLLQYATAQHTDDVFLNMGVGVLQYARERRNLYRALFLDQTRGYDPGPDLKPILLDLLSDYDCLEALSPGERERLLLHMNIYTFGLATHICTGLGDAALEAEALNYLEEVGGTLIAAAMPAGVEYPTDPRQRGTTEEEADGS
jgi:AcrR family transcriptional regulator